MARRRRKRYMHVHVPDINVSSCADQQAETIELNVVDRNVQGTAAEPGASTRAFNKRLSRAHGIRISECIHEYTCVEWKTFQH